MFRLTSITWLLLLATSALTFDVAMHGDINGAIDEASSNFDVATGVATGTLVDVIKNVDIPWDPDTEDISIRTVGGINSNEYMKVEFLSPLGNTAGGVNVIFTNPVLYWLSYCQSNPIPFLTTLPKETIWTIKYIHAELRVIFYCNGVEELNVDLSSDCSYGHWKRVWRTKPVRIKFNSKDTASDGYSLSFDKYGLETPTEELIGALHICEAGSYLSPTDGRCVVCEENTYSPAGAYQCNPCPDSMFSAQGSTSLEDCFLKTAEIKFGRDTSSATIGTIYCIEAETGLTVSDVEFSNGKFVSMPSDWAEVALSCDDPTWTASAPGYHPVSIDIEIPEFVGDFTKTAEIIDEGTILTLNSEVTDSSLTVDWYKADRAQGRNLIQKSAVSIDVSVAGRYEARIYRCPTHTPALNVFNVVTRIPEFSKSGSVCSVYGDPHVHTFDGFHYSFQGECTYVLAMDSESYDWYVYGKFTACGYGVTCLSSMSVVTQGVDEIAAPTMLEIKRGFGINDGGIMKGVSRGETLSIGNARLTFDGLFLHVDNGQVSVQWDGLSFGKISVSEGTKTSGLCGDNDGSSDNEVDHVLYADGPEGMSFADTWSVSPKGACGINLLDNIEVEPSAIEAVFANFVTSPFLSLDFDNQGLVEIFLLDAALDRQMENSSYFKEKYMECSCLRAMFEHIKDTKGVTFDRSDLDLNCPTPRQMLLEGVRHGCPWTKENAPFYIPGII